MSPYINRATLAFWVIGLLNNMPYVIMLAGAKNISEGGTALVFIANVLPSLLLKISSPYWFDKVCYRTRMKAGSILMASSFCVVAWFSRMGEVEDQNQNKEGVSSFNVMMQLIGVALGSAQGGLGEATLLALSGKADSVMQNERLSVINYDENYRVVGELDGIIENAAPKGEDKSMCIAAFSSGTGFAGIAGFLFVFICTRIFSLSLPGTLSFCLILPILYWYVFEKCLAEYTHTDLVNEEVLDTGSSEIMLTSNELIALSSGNHANASDSTTSSEDDFQDNPASRDNSDDENSESSSMHLTERDPTNNIPIDTMSAFERFRLILSLWPYMVPLFTVYAAEYALQSGVWAAIGFPVDDVLKRDSFYVASNWVYQVGVFVSRSSGAFFTAPMWMLWLMPFLQIINLIVFYCVAAYRYQFWYSNVLLIGCFYVGLLGGAVYVHGYSRINKDLPVSVREFALSSASVADGFGIVLADISGLFIQSCLYDSNGISGAAVSCPL